MKMMVPPYFELEELGVLVGVEDLAPKGPVDILLQHPVVAVSDGLLQDFALLGVVADRRLPALLNAVFVAHLIYAARVLHSLY